MPRGQYKRKSLAERFATKWALAPESGCHIWIAARDSKGYGCIQSGSGRLIGAHVAAWILTHGDLAPGLQVLHRCDVPLCVNVAHLFAGTNRQNIDDKVAKGRQARGEALSLTMPHGPEHHNCKISVEDIVAMREMHARGVSDREIAEHFGCSPVYAWRVTRWKRRKRG